MAGEVICALIKLKIDKDIPQQNRAKTTSRYQMHYPCRLGQWLNINKNPNLSMI